MKFENKKLTVEIDENTGYTASIQSNVDEYQMNWILKNSDFGKVDGFATKEINVTDTGVEQLAVCEDWRNKISLKISKQITDEGYFESYTFLNNNSVEWFINKDSFGIHFPFDCLGTGKTEFHEKTCNSHLWCGDDICWIYCSKISGDKLRLIVNMTEGSIGDYSISRDRARIDCAADYRGAFVLNPAINTVLPGESITYKFRFSFTDSDPIEALRNQSGFIHLSADKYTVTKGEKIKFSAYCIDGLKDISVTHNGENVVTQNGETSAYWETKFNEIGEKKFTLKANGKKTFIIVNVIEKPETILKKRANFIAKKQQYHAKGSALDGAYLAYDKDTESVYYSPAWADHNAGRERIAMGITVLKQLQKEYDSELFESITKHREFIERELFDSNTCEVFNEVGKNNERLRLYNFPWMAVYFYEWFVLTNELRFLKYAAGILIKYYEWDTNDGASQCFEAYRIICDLKKQGLTDLAQQVKDGFLILAEKMYKANFNVKSEETGWVSESSTVSATQLLQGYLLTGDKKYLAEAERYIESAKSFYGFQPDYHLNMVCVRHWDRFWFGRHFEYGDVFPHYWSVLAAEMYYWYQKATGKDCRKEIDTIIDANLCLFRPDGFAHNNYLYPYKVTVFSSTERIPPDAGFGTFYGKRYDERANDQDWVLYYSSVLR